MLTEQKTCIAPSGVENNADTNSVFNNNTERMPAANVPYTEN